MAAFKFSQLAWAQTRDAYTERLRFAWVQCALVFLGVMFMTPICANAGLTFSFANGDALDGHVAGSIADFLIDGQLATLTTRTVTPSGSLNTNSGVLGINAAGPEDEPAAFDNGERWVFDWNIDTLFEGIDLQLFSTSTELFSLQSDDWMGLTLIPGESDHINFDQLLGAFTFTSGDFTDNFTLTDLTGGVLLPVSAGADLTLAYSDSNSGNAQLQSLTFAASTATVPEPGTLVLTALGVLAILMFGRRTELVRRRT